MDRTDSHPALRQIMAWYDSHCDNDWEHQNGLTLQSLDNPGWMITVNLVGTAQEHAGFSKVGTDPDGTDTWLVIEKKGATLQGACGPAQLEVMLDVIAKWLRPRVV